MSFQPLANKRKETFPGREGPGAVTPSSVSGSTEHCSTQEEPQPFISPQETSSLALFISGRCSPAAPSAGQPARNPRRVRLRGTLANTLEKELGSGGIRAPHPRSQLATRTLLHSRYKVPSYFYKLWPVLTPTPSARPGRWHFALSGEGARRTRGGQGRSWAGGPRRGRPTPALPPPGAGLAAV